MAAVPFDRMSTALRRLELTAINGEHGCRGFAFGALSDEISPLRCLVRRLALVNCQVSWWGFRSAWDVILLSVSLSHPVSAAYSPRHSRAARPRLQGKGRGAALAKT